MSLRDKLLKVKKSAPLYKLQTPQVLKEDHLTNNSKKWLSKGIDITDYFNYGFNDATLKLYIQKLSKLTDLNLSKLQKEYNARAAKQQANIIFKDNIPMDYGGLGIPSVPECVPPDIEQQKEALIIDNYNFEGDLGNLLYTNETILNIFSHYKQYLEKLITEHEFFDFDFIIKSFSKEQNNWQKELEKILRKDINNNEHNNGTPERKKSKHEKKKSKKEKKQKKEKKKKHKKKHSQEESIQIVPQQIFVKEDSISLQSKSEKIEVEQEQQQEQKQVCDSISDQLSKQQQENIQLSSPSPQYEPQIQQPLPVIQPLEQPKQRNHNWPRNLIHGILERNKNQQRR